MSDLQTLLSSGYDRESWLARLQQFFPGIEIFSQPQAVEDNRAASFDYLGKVPTADGQQLGIYEIKVGANTQLARNRVQLRQMVAKQVSAHTLGGALAVYYDHGQQWRFSFISMEYKLNEQGQIDKQESTSKRYTYLLGKGANVRTAVERFDHLPQQPSLEDFKAAFAVEPLNKEFYEKLFNWYEYAKSEVVFPNDEREPQDNHTATSLIRLLTRLLFVWFIKEKKLVNPDLFDQEQLQSIIDWKKDSSYYKAILQNLFFATLNREIKDRSFRTTTDGKANSSNYLVTNIYRYRDHFQESNKDNIIARFAQTPFLNGGLFECLDRQANEDEQQKYEKDKTIRNERYAMRMDGFSDRADNPLSLPNALFFSDDERKPGLIDLLHQYQFTVEESTPLDIEVALDPELLGKVFENLLAAYNPETEQTARNATGSYYTPREIVGYMVDESLKAYLAGAVPPQDGDAEFWRERLDDLFNMASQTGELAEKNGKALLYDEEIPELIQAIDQVKILDPAVGSGAFPMGALQRLVGLLAILDPNNRQWKEQQLLNLPDMQSIQADLQTSENINDWQARQKAQEELQQRKQEITRAFETEADYARKLYLIENAICGVDIQPIACQIAKLRFFISLAIEQQPTADKKDNYGIKALPNLETRFIAANSLIGLDKPRQTVIRNPAIQEKERELNRVRRRHFNAKTLKTKRQYREQDKTLREEIAALLISDGWGDSNAEKVAHWDPYNQNAVADWFDPEWMFGISDGFDVVLGNPPYIQLQKNGGMLANLYENRGFETFVRSGDIYQLFYERAGQLLGNQSHLCFITSNKWMRAKYGEKLRAFFTTLTPKVLLDFGGFKVFENATVDTNILLITKENVQGELWATAFKDDFKQGDSIGDYAQNNAVSINVTPDTWFIGSRAEVALKEKIERIGTPLKEWDIAIYRGILTGLNAAFIVDKKTKDALIAEDPRSAELLKPILRGRDIKRYRAEWAGLWVIATLPSLHVDIENYPAIKRYLLSYGKEKLEQTGETLVDGSKSRKKTPHQWFELQDTCAYHAEFERDKLVWGNLSVQPRFAVDTDASSISAPTNLLTGTDQIKYIAAILNSSFCYWSMRRLAYSREHGYMEYKKIFVEQIHIPKISKVRQQPFTDLVDKILAAKKANPDADTSEREKEIDRLVYALYDLTEKEIQVIEGIA